MSPFLLLLLAAAAAVNCEVHTLTYIYTALSKPAGLPGIHEFSAMGLLDDKMIDYFDSDNQVKVPKQAWMKERLPEDYWKKGTESRISKQLWFKANIDILINRMNQSSDEIHILQWQHGCQGQKQPDGSLKFLKGMDMYNYDGNDFLSFDIADQVWVAPIQVAQPTKRKWDAVLVLNDYTKGYLEKECMDWLSKFVTYGEKQISHSSPPQLFMYATPAREESNVVLRCMATGFYPKHIVLLIKRNGRILTKDDGVGTTGVRPNEDDTYQRRDFVEILKSDESDYCCHVFHQASGFSMEKCWDHTVLQEDGAFIGMVVTAVIVGVAILAALAFALVWWRRRRLNPSQPVLQGGNVNLETTIKMDGVTAPLMTDVKKTSIDSLGGQSDSGVSSENLTSGVSSENLTSGVSSTGSSTSALAPGSEQQDAAAGRLTDESV